MAVALSTQSSHRPLAGRSRAAERITRLLGRLLRPAAGGAKPLDPAQLSPYWLRDLGLPEDYGRSHLHGGLADWTRLDRYR